MDEMREKIEKEIGMIANAVGASMHIIDQRPYAYGWLLYFATDKRLGDFGKIADQCKDLFAEEAFLYGTDEKKYVMLFKSQSTKEYWNVNPNFACNTDNCSTIYPERNQDGVMVSSSTEMLDELIGLEQVKEEIRKYANFLAVQKRREENGDIPVNISYHLVFTGNPGTGKTVVARIIADIYKRLGILSKGQLIEVDRSQLVAGYEGQTALKTQKMIEEAKGGVLFIDEAYTLADGKDFGQESIETLLKAMEDNRNDFVVIVAGYKDQMNRFINSNPGLKSRFTRFIDFADYSSDELQQIFIQLCNKNGYSISNDAKYLIKRHFDNEIKKKTSNYGNAREVRNYFERIVVNQANRLASYDEISKDQLNEIEVDDIK